MKRQIILITGANRGIGYGIAEKYAINKNLDNKTIIMTSRVKQDGEEAAHKLTYDYPDIARHLVHHELDIRSNHSIKKLVNFINDKFGQFDVLYNNAGLLFKGPIPEDREQRRKEIIQIFETNVWGLVYLTEDFLPLMEKQNSGNIINISSELGKIKLASKELMERFMDEHLTLDKLRKLYHEYEHAYIEQTTEFEKAWKDDHTGYGAYPVSKMFLNSYTMLLARRMKKHDYNIKVNAVTPGWVRTRMGGDNAIRSVEQGAETPYWIGNFTTDRDDSLSGNFYRDKRIMQWSGIVKDERI
jgi:NAD(P)-dependent dehydrogenase (short-subunit alcohol dehydrogenase family)